MGVEWETAKLGCEATLRPPRPLTPHPAWRRSEPSGRSQFVQLLGKCVLPTPYLTFHNVMRRPHTLWWLNYSLCRRELSIERYQALRRRLHPRSRKKQVSKSGDAIAAALATTFVVEGGPSPLPPLGRSKSAYFG